MSAIFEDKIEDFDLVTKLNKLDEITSSTQRSTSYTAWRPSVTGTVERSQAGQDLVVANREKEELLELLKQVESEVGRMEEDVKEAGRRLNTNSQVLAKGEKDMGEIQEKLTSGAM